METAEIVETDLDFEGRIAARDETNRIVIHHTGGAEDVDVDAETIDSWHKNQGWAGIGYHFVVRKDGTIERGRPEWAIGAHAEGDNYDSIGIHLSGNFTEAAPTTKQVERTAILLANLCDKYDLPIDRQHILGHRELGGTSCPGDVLYDMLDEIVGKANFYRYGEEGETAEEPTGEETGEETGMRYNTVEEVPAWGRPTIDKLIARGYLKGDGGGLDLSNDMLRLLVILKRAGLFD